jgi:hypothetical protein
MSVAGPATVSPRGQNDTVPERLYGAQVHADVFCPLRTASGPMPATEADARGAVSDAISHGASPIAAEAMPVPIRGDGPTPSSAESGSSTDGRLTDVGTDLGVGRGDGGLTDVCRPVDAARQVLGPRWGVTELPDGQTIAVVRPDNHLAAWWSAADPDLEQRARDLVAGWAGAMDYWIRHDGLQHVSVVVGGLTRTLRIDRREQASGVYGAGYVRTTCGLRYPLSALAPVWGLR